MWKANSQIEGFSQQQGKLRQAIVGRASGIVFPTPPNPPGYLVHYCLCKFDIFKVHVMKFCQIPTSKVPYGKVFVRCLLICLAFTLSNCTALFTGLYGIKTPKHVDTRTILRYAKKYNIPHNLCYALDSSYTGFLKSLDTSRFQLQVKNHLQPLQALYYNKSGQLQSFQVNCYAGGFPNLNWNRNGNMAVFPPKQQAPLDSIVPLDEHIRHLVPLAAKTAPVNGAHDWVVVVHWSRFMGRQSKRFIRIVQQNRQLAGTQQVKVLYVNSDNPFALRPKQHR